MHLSIQDWSGIAQAVGTIVGIVAVYLTVRHGSRMSNREKSFDAYIYFSEKFDDLAAKRRSLRNRFAESDTTLSIRHVRAYFKDYQNLLYREWELYRGGVVANEVFDSWAMGTHRYLHRAEPIHYFDADGQVQFLTTMDGVMGVLQRSKVADPDFMAYMRMLLQLPVPEGSKAEQAWRRKVSKVVSSIARSRAWTL